MRALPNVMNLCRVVHSQQLLSGGIAKLAENLDTGLHDRCLARQETYADLQQELRNVGSRIGTGGLAVAESAAVLSRLKLRHCHMTRTLIPEFCTHSPLSATGHSPPPRREQPSTRRPRPRAVHTLQRWRTRDRARARLRPSPALL